MHLEQNNPCNFSAIRVCDQGQLPVSGSLPRWSILADTKLF